MRAGRNCNSLKEVVSAINDGETAIIYNPPETGIKEELEEMRRILFKLGKMIVGDTQRKWCTVFFDEVHNFGEDLNLWFQQGRRWGIICVGISQRPALTSHTILTQAEYHIIFKCSPYETLYFEKYHIPLSEFEDWLNQPYHYVIVFPQGFKKFKPIKPE
jgi:hypothetical protein